MMMTNAAREEFARQCWYEIEYAARGDDDRELWFAWKRNFPHRFWRDLNAAGIGALCADVGLDYSAILRRVTTYDMTLSTREREDEERLVKMTSRPPPSA